MGKVLSILLTRGQALNTQMKLSSKTLQENGIETIKKKNTNLWFMLDTLKNRRKSKNNEKRPRRSI